MFISQKEVSFPQYKRELLGKEHVANTVSERQEEKWNFPFAQMPAICTPTAEPCFLCHNCFPSNKVAHYCYYSSSEKEQGRGFTMKANTSDWDCRSSRQSIMAMSHLHRRSRCPPGRPPSTFSFLNGTQQSKHVDYVAFHDEKKSLGTK